MCVAECCGVLQCVAAYFEIDHLFVGMCSYMCVAECCSVLQCAAVCCSVI